MSTETDEPQPAPPTGHHESIGQPHTPAEGEVAHAEAVAARISSDDAPMGTSAHVSTGARRFSSG